MMIEELGKNSARITVDNIDDFFKIAYANDVVIRFVDEDDEYNFVLKYEGDSNEN